MPSTAYPPLSYEQLLALRIMRDAPDKGGHEIAEEANCAWRLMFDMNDAGLALSGYNRVAPKLSHPTITEEGLKTLQSAEEAGVI